MKTERDLWGVVGAHAEAARKVEQAGLLLRQAGELLTYPFGGVLQGLSEAADSVVDLLVPSGDECPTCGGEISD